MPVTAHPASQQGIDTRALPPAVRALRLGIRALRLVSRRAAARALATLFSRPRRHPAPEREVALAARAERRTVQDGDKRVQAYVWGDAGPERTCVLVHGWEGRGTQLGAFVDPLVEAGWRVVAFDHVGHGASDGKRCSLPRMRDTLRRVVEETVGVAPAAVVAHSMGSFATTLLLAEGWRGTRAVYVSPPDDLLVYFGRYVEIVTGDRDLLPDLIRITEERVGEAAESFEFPRLVGLLDQPLLALHSTDDADVPIDAGRRVVAAWRGARMVEVDGLGHRRILRDPAVVRAAVDFVAAGANADAAGA
ncbi:MAG: alpha/beta fold hydrolase [Planctomycetota bacterium]